MLTPNVTEICRASAHNFVYVESDVPAGITLREWRTVRGRVRRDDPSRVRELVRSAVTTIVGE